MKRREGTSLSELVVVTIIIGVLAVFGVPRFHDAVERAKASEAFAFLATVALAQEGYLARQGRYAARLCDLEIHAAAPRFFFDAARGAIGPATTFVDTSPGARPGWKLTLVREAASSTYGEYTVTFRDGGFDRASSTI